MKFTKFNPYAVLIITGLLMLATVLFAQTRSSVALLKAGVVSMDRDASSFAATLLSSESSDKPAAVAEASHSMREDDYLARIRQIQRSWEKDLQVIREDLQSKAREIEEIVVTPTAKNIEITKYLILWAAGL